MRITNSIRNKIENALIDRAFNDRYSELTKRENALALALYRQAVPEEVEKQADKLVSLVQAQEGLGRWLYNCCGVYFRLDGGLRQHVDLSHSRPFSLHGTPHVDLRGENPLIEQAVSYIADRDALETEIRQRRAEIGALLKPVYTPEKLRAIWPEIMPIAQPILDLAGLAEKKPQLPAVLPAHLNAALDLPVEERELEAA